MALTFEVLGKRHLEWLRCLRNANRSFFFDSREITELEIQQVWFRTSTERGDLNLVIKDNTTDERIGFISVYNIVPGGAEIGRMMIDDKFRKQGYMEKAMIKVFDICRMLGIESLTLEVKSCNIPARQLYVKMGFVTFGLTGDSLIMRKML